MVNIILKEFHVSKLLDFLWNVENTCVPRYTCSTGKKLSHEMKKMNARERKSDNKQCLPESEDGPHRIKI